MTQVVQPQRVDIRTRIIEAAARLLQELGPAGVTTRGVAHAAGVQAPAIYRIFGDKDGLLDAVAEHELARYVTAKSEAEDSGDAVADLRAAWHRHIQFGLTYPALFTLLADPARASRSPAAAAGLQVLRERVHRVAVAGRLGVPERRAVELIHAAGTGTVLTLAALPPAGRDETLADSLLEATLACILADRGAPAAVPDPTTSAAVALRAAAPQLVVLSPGERRLLAEWLDRVASG